MLEGIRLRHAILDALLPIMAVVDNCCEVRKFLVRGIPDLEVILDVYHFMMRCVNNGIGSNGIAIADLSISGTYPLSLMGRKILTEVRLRRTSVMLS